MGEAFFGNGFFLFGGLLLVLWFVMIKPARKQQREVDSMLSGLKKNDNVRTSAGFFGKVVSVDKDQDQVVLRVDENKDVRIKVLRSSIVAVVPSKKKEKKKQEA